LDFSVVIQHLKRNVENADMSNKKDKQEMFGCIIKVFKVIKKL